MRRRFYLGFGVVLLIIFLMLLMLHDARWFLAVFVPLSLVAIYDLSQKKHAILRNFPILGHVRFLLEFFRPEIRQYFIAGDEEERPFDRETRNTVYQRAKNMDDTIPFGTERDILAVGYTWAQHSLNPKPVSAIEPRITIGGPQCTQPYSASRLNISAMSFGALSENAIRAMNLGALLGNFYHNTGEGGLSRYHLSGGDVVWQIGTAYFGCRDNEGKFDPLEFQKEAINPLVKMIEIKLSQGAKPSHGGILPAAKVTPEIAAMRKISLGKDVLSPPAHSAFSSPEGLLQFIQTVRELCGGKPVGFKFCLGRPSEFFGICKAMLKTGILPDFITVDGAEGGTGAAPMEFANHMGTPLNVALITVHNALVGIGVRDHIRVICSGKVATGFDMVSKIALGADICNSARAMMMATGCIQSMQCNTNACPTGVATQNKRLMRALVVDDKKIRVRNYHHNTVHSFLELIGAMGLTNPSDLTPDRIIRRTSINKIQSYAQIYHYLKPGDLLNTDTMPETWRDDWSEASAEAF